VIGEIAPIVAGLAATAASGPAAAIIRSWILKRTRTTRVVIENADGAVESSIHRMGESDDEYRKELALVTQQMKELLARDHQTGASVATSSQDGSKSVVVAEEKRSSRFAITIVDSVHSIAMLAGIAAKAAWDFSNKNGRFGIDIGDAATALLVAPIVYVGAASALAPHSKSVSLVGIGLAFQNGFFWQAVFATQAEANGGAGTAQN
jgi:hypothetical protein